MNNPLNKVSEVGDVITRAISIASSKREQILRQAVNAVLLFFILVIFGCLDFATLTFHVEYLTQAGFWGTTISKTIAGLCALNIGINVMWETEVKRDLVLAFAISRYEILTKERDKHFEYFVTKVYNIEEKKNAYISQINQKIYLLNKISPAKSRLLYTSELPENQEKKLHDRYCIKRAELEALKQDDYINKNIDTLKVRYIEVYPQVFELEIDGSTVMKGTKTKGSIAAGKAKVTGSTLMGMIAFSMFVTAFGLELSKDQFDSQMEAFLHYCLKCAEDIAIILWQVTQGMFKTKRIVSNELTQPYVGRNKVLLKFLEWKVEKGYMTQERYNEIIKEINDIKINGAQSEERFVEITEEQYQAMTKGEE